MANHLIIRGLGGKFLFTRGFGESSGPPPSPPSSSLVIRGLGGRSLISRGLGAGSTTSTLHGNLITYGFGTHWLVTYGLGARVGVAADVISRRSFLQGRIGGRTSL